MKKIVTASVVSLILAFLLVACESDSDSDNKTPSGWNPGHGAGGDATRWINSTATATGTYSYNSATGVLTFDVTKVELFCDGPEVGTETRAVVRLDATTLEVEGNLIFTRSPGDPGSIAGAWVHENTTWNLGLDGSLKITILGINCISLGSGRNCTFNQQFVSIYVHDVKRRAVKINMYGRGIASSPDLFYEPSGFEGEGLWTFSGGSWTLTLNPADEPKDRPPLTYYVSITDANGTNTFATVLNKFPPCSTCVKPDGMGPSGRGYSNPVQFEWAWAPGTDLTGFEYYSFYDNISTNNLKYCEVPVLYDPITRCSQVPSDAVGPYGYLDYNYFTVTSYFDYGFSIQLCGPFFVQ